jgi:hypothetical protein
MIINDGTGGGKSAEVDSENRLKVQATKQTLHSHSSEEEGNAYMWSTTQSLAGDKCLIFLRNDNTDMNLIIEKIIVSPDVACQFEVWVGSNVTTEAGTSVVGVNLNLQSGHVAEATCTHSETGADQGGSMTLLGTAWAGVGINAVALDSALILGYLDEVAINLITDAGSTSANIMGYYHD